MFYRFFFGVGRVFLQGLMDNCIVTQEVILFVQQNSLGSRIKDLIYVFLFKNGITIQDNFVSFNGNNFTSVLINEILMPSFQYTGGQFPANVLFKTGFGGLYFFR